MTLSDISIRNPVFAWMMMAAFIVFGFICFMRMGVSNLPDVDFPVVNVSITLPNASPEVVESDVADPIEQAVLGAQGVVDVQTTCTQGNANTTVYLDLSRNVDSAVQDVQTLVFQAQKQLPTNIFPPVIRKQNPNASPILWFAVTADPPLTLRDMMLYSRDHIQDKFTSLNGVSTPGGDGDSHGVGRGAIEGAGDGVLRQGMLPVVAGLASGAVAALIIGRYLASLLFAVSPRDPLAFAAAGTVLLVVSAMACLIPARRATKVNPSKPCG